MLGTYRPMLAVAAVAIVVAVGLLLTLGAYPPASQKPGSAVAQAPGQMWANPKVVWLAHTGLLSELLTNQRITSG